jgi:hypothetical protein
VGACQGGLLEQDIDRYRHPVSYSCSVRGWHKLVELHSCGYSMCGGWCMAQQPWCNTQCVQQAQAVTTQSACVTTAGCPFCTAICEAAAQKCRIRHGQSQRLYLAQVLIPNPHDCFEIGIDDVLHEHDSSRHAVLLRCCPCLTQML